MQGGLERDGAVTTMEWAEKATDGMPRRDATEANLPPDVRLSTTPFRQEKVILQSGIGGLMFSSIEIYE